MALRTPAISGMLFCGRKFRHADPRWKTNRYEVMFEQKGLFQADVSIHHALCATALQNYHKSAQRLQNGSPLDPFGGPDAEDSALEAQLSNSELPGNEWGFDNMSERIAAAQETSAEGLEANAEGPVVRLPHLQVLEHYLSLHATATLPFCSAPYVHT